MGATRPGLCTASFLRPLREVEKRAELIPWCSPCGVPPGWAMSAWKEFVIHLAQRLGEELLHHAAALHELRVLLDAAAEHRTLVHQGVDHLVLLVDVERDARAPLGLGLVLQPALHALVLRWRQRVPAGGAAGQSGFGLEYGL